MATMAGGEGQGRGAEARARGRGDVFPGLGLFIGTGILLGLLSALLVGGLPARPHRSMLKLAAELVGLGAIVGLFVGLGRGAWRPGRPARVPGPVERPANALWDPWLDHGRDPDRAPEVIIEELAADPDAGIAIVPPSPRAPVRPRVIAPETGEAVPLEDAIGPMIQDGRGGLVVILGGPGSGKTTASRHLAAVLPPWARGRIRLIEFFDLAAIAAAGPEDLIVLALDSGRVTQPGYEGVLIGCPADERAALDRLLASRSPAIYRLAPWGRDDAIEYLLATDREACASVMARLGRAGDLEYLDGIPEMCSAVLDRMARDESIGDARTALRRELWARMQADAIPREPIADRVVESFRADATEPVEAMIAKALTSPGGYPERIPYERPFARLIRHRPAALLLAADRVSAIIEDGCPRVLLALPFPRELVREVARRVADRPSALEHLREWLEDARGGFPPLVPNVKKAVHPLAASVLHAAEPGWRPAPGSRPRLEGAYLDGVAWPDLDLPGGDLNGARLRGADLRGANLEDARARRACLRGANLQDAALRRWSAVEADLGRADLSRARAPFSCLTGADLTGAILVDADLYRAHLIGARIDGADFTRANLEDARLKGLPLRHARIDGARLGGADLRKCDLEAKEVIDIDLHDADLRGALLTFSRMPDANLLGADLRDAKLAEIDWPGACLRDADLRGANFHLGTTRSGRLDSPIACEGSRTGFYTHDDLDLNVRPAEEIRKANLRGADLRGAEIRGVDFYLVDLRGALYDPDQAEHFRRCRAILDDPGD